MGSLLKTGLSKQVSLNSGKVAVLKASTTLTPSNDLGKTPILPELQESYTEFKDRVSPSLMYDFDFGTSKVTDGTSIAVTSTTVLDDYWEPYAENTTNGASFYYVINKEIQRYKPFAAGSNFVFASDALELTATTGQTAVFSASPTGNVSYSRTIPLASTGSIPVGSIVGFGSAQYANLHSTMTFSITGTPVEGDTCTLTLRDRDMTYSVSLTCTADASPSTTEMAASLVTSINADATLIAKKITAYVLPETPGGFGVTVARIASGVDAKYGYSGEGAVDSVFTSSSMFTTTGSGLAANLIQRSFYPTYVVSKTAGSVTLSHPVTVTTGDTLTVSASKVITLASSISNNANIPVGAGFEALVEADQCIQLSYQDSNLRRVTGTSSGVITLESAVWGTAGLLIVVLPVWMIITTSSMTDTVTVPCTTGIPSGVADNMVISPYFAGTYSDGQYTITGKTATTLTVDRAQTASNATRFVIHHNVDSAQIWSKFIAAPGFDSCNMIFGEIEAEFPDASDLAAWPAFWNYSATNDPNPGAGSGNSEIDFTDTFNYWNNTINNSFMGMLSNASSNPVFFREGRYTSDTGHLLGNNLGIRSRTLQFVWTDSKIYFYIDGLLVKAANFTWGTYRRSQFAANLAVGSVSTSFNSNGFFPVDVSQFPMKLRVKRIKFFQQGTTVVPPPI